MTEREVTDRITESGETAEMSASECTFYSLPVNRMDKKTAWHHSMRLINQGSLACIQRLACYQDQEDHVSRYRIYFVEWRLFILLAEVQSETCVAKLTGNKWHDSVL